MAECYRRYSIKLTNYSIFNNALFGFVTDLSLPFTFSEIPIKLFTVTIGNGFGSPGGHGGDTLDSIKLLCYGTASGSQTCIFNIYVYGKL